MDSNSIIVFLVVLLATFTQISGFGSGLVTMAFLPAVIGIRASAPLVALFAGTLESILFLRYRNSLNIQAVWRLLAAAIVGLTAGVRRGAGHSDSLELARR